MQKKLIADGNWQITQKLEFFWKLKEISNVKELCDKNYKMVM